MVLLKGREVTEVAKDREGENDLGQSMVLLKGREATEVAKEVVLEQSMVLLNKEGATSRTSLGRN